MICIYAIINIVDDKHYIGQTFDRDFRWKEHLKSLKGFYHHSILLQRAWHKHGADKFIFVVLEVLTDISKLNERERYWGNLLKPEYNIAPLGGSMRGYKHTEEAKINMSNAHKGKIQHSEEEKKKRSERMKGNKFAAGKKHTAERIEARALLHRGKPKSIEHKAKIAAGNRGKLISEETKRKMSEAAFRRWNGS